MYVVIDGIAYIGESGYAQAYNYDGGQGTDVVILDSVTFNGVTLPVTSIGDYAFYGTQLTSVVFPGSLTSIGDYAFFDNQLTSVVFPGSLTSIGVYAFFDNQLTSVAFYGPAPSVDYSSFSENTPTFYHSAVQTGYDQTPWTDWDLVAVGVSWVVVEDVSSETQAYSQAVSDLKPLNWEGDGLWWSSEHDAVYIPDASTGTPIQNGTTTPTITEVDSDDLGRYVYAKTSLAPFEFDESSTPDPDLTPQPRPGGGSQLVGQQVAGLSASNGVVVLSGEWARLINTTGDETFATADNITNAATGKAIVEGQGVVELAEPDKIDGPSVIGEDVKFRKLTITDTEGYGGPPFSGSNQSLVAADYLMVMRRDPDGTVATIADRIDPESSVVDPIPAISRNTVYWAVSMTNLPSSSSGPETKLTLPAGHIPVYLNSGSGFRVVVPLWDNTELSRSGERGKSRHYRAGRTRPVTKWGTQRNEAYTLSATLSPSTPGGNTIEELFDLEDIAHVACYRDPLGQKFFVTVDSVDASVRLDGRWEVSVPLTAEDFDETTMTYHQED